LATAGTVFVDRNAVMYVTDDNAGLYVWQYEPASS
jgi:secreted PhoX family phosphatase